jgi:hypothetical protein
MGLPQGSEWMWLSDFNQDTMVGRLDNLPSFKKGLAADDLVKVKIEKKLNDSLSFFVFESIHKKVKPEVTLFRLTGDLSRSDTRRIHASLLKVTNKSVLMGGGKIGGVRMISIQVPSEFFGNTNEVLQEVVSERSGVSFEVLTRRG